MFKSIVHDANVSLNGKMKHLQNSVVGRAKSAIERYGYSGDSYYEALKELESRIGKPSLVVKVTLDRLRKTARIQNDKPQEVRNLSDVVSTTVWTLKKFGYESDLKTEANVSLAVDKLSQELKIKWKDNTKATKLERPSLVDFSLWLKGQADIYDDCYPKVSGRFSSQPPKNKTRFGGPSGMTERHNTFLSNFVSRPKPKNSSCIMGDGQGHKLSSCPKFKALSVQERLKEVQKHGLLLADVAERLGLDGPVEGVLLNGIQKTSELLTKRINVQVSPVNDFGTQYDVNGVLVVHHLNVPQKKVKLRELQEKWPHLSDLELTEVAGTQVTLLLGSDVAELIVSLEIRHGPKGSPVGVHTRIGWTVSGRVPGYIQGQESVCKVHVATSEE
ncbi:uncharacterized protein [Montipora foliosa]|uniref:uncharacterized protein n=1 Tax=Montipora foliosa TaxID=591990 RepID=UPI0035F2196C